MNLPLCQILSVLGKVKVMSSLRVAPRCESSRSRGTNYSTGILAPTDGRCQTAEESRPIWPLVFARSERRSWSRRDDFEFWELDSAMPAAVFHLRLQLVPNRLNFRGNVIGGFVVTPGEEFDENCFSGVVFAAEDDVRLLQDETQFR